MIKFYSLLIAGIILLPSVIFAQKPVVTVKATAAAFTMDGLASEGAWASATKIAVDKPYNGETVVGGSATFQMLNDADNIYIFVDVKDDVVTLDTDADWKGDKIEIYFGLPDYVPGTGANADHCRQFFGNASQDWVDGTVPAHWGDYSLDLWPGVKTRGDDGVTFGYNETVDGYAYEFTINKSALENVDFAAIDSLGFDITVADNDVVGAGLGVRNRLVYYNTGNLEFANENWNAIDLATLKFEKAASTNAFMVKKASAPIEIDGSGNDAAWASVVKTAIDKPFAGETVVGGSATFQMLYDADNLYIFVDVKDDVVTLDTDADWKGDKIELYFGLPGYVPGTGANAEHCRQFFGNANQDWVDGTVPAHWGDYSLELWPGVKTRGADGVTFGYNETVDGYAYEFKINKSALENVDFSTIDSLAFDFSLADNDVEGAGKGVRNRLVYFNTGNLQFANENWNALDLAGLGFDKSTAVAPLNKTPEQAAWISYDMLRFKGYDNAVNAEIYSILGQKVMSVKNVNEVNVANLRSGIYLVRVNNGAKAFKVIK